MSVARTSGEALIDVMLGRLGDLLDVARRESAAAARSEGRLVRLVVAAPAVEPRAVLRVASADSFSWEPSEGLELGGLGRAAVCVGEGDERWRQVREAAERTASRLLVFADAGIEAPPALFVGGGAFRPEGAVRARWAGFGDASFVLPRWLVRRRPVRSGLGGREDDPARVPATTLELVVDAFELAEKGTASFLREAEALVDSMPSSLPAGELAPIEASWTEREATKERWCRAALGILDAIRRGEVRKAVAARWLDVRLPEIAGQLPDDVPTPGVVERILAAFERGCSECTRFVVQRGGHAFLGATPEVLLELRDRRLRTHALAGTEPNDAGVGPRDSAECPAGGGAAQRLLSRDKDRREHQLVVEHIVDRLAPYCAELDVPDEPRVKTLRHLLHLETPIVGRLDRHRHVLELAAALHPTPAVAGLPVERSLALLASLETGERGWYAGPVGWFDEQGDGALSVALRSMLVGRSSARLFAGAGIVSDSQPMLELEETRWKLAGAWTALSAAVGGRLEIERGPEEVGVSGEEAAARVPATDRCSIDRGT